MRRWGKPFGIGFTIMALLIAWNPYSITRFIQRYLFEQNWFSANGPENLLLSIVLCCVGLLLLSRAQGQSPLWSLAATTLYITPHGYGYLRIFGFIAPIIALLQLIPYSSTTTSNLGEQKGKSLFDDLKRLLPSSTNSLTRGDSPQQEISEPSISTSSFCERLTITSFCVFVLAGLLPTFTLFRAFWLIQDWITIHQEASFYVLLPYQEMIVVYGLSGLLGVTGAAIFAFRITGRLRGTLTSLLIVILGFLLPFIIFPKAPEYDNPIHAKHRVMLQMKFLQSSLMLWSEQTGHFPQDQQELSEATRETMEHKSPSLYGDSHQHIPPKWYQKRHFPGRLPYQLIYKPKTKGPYQQIDPETKPAMILYTASSDLQQAWLVGMGIHANTKIHVAKQATVIHTIPLAYSSKPPQK